MNDYDDYYALEDSEFDESDEDENAEDNKEDEEENPGEEEWGEEFLTTSGDDENLPPDDDNASWLASAAQTPSQPDAMAEDSLDIPQSPVVAAVKRAEARGSKRTITASDAQKVTSGTSNPATLLDGMPNYRKRPSNTQSFRQSNRLPFPNLQPQSSASNQPPSEQQSATSYAPSPFMVPTEPVHRPSNSVQPPPLSATTPALSSLAANNTSAETQRNKKTTFSRYASAPDLTKAVPGSPSVPYSSRQKVARYENQQVLDEHTDQLNRQAHNVIQLSPSPSPYVPWSPSPSFVAPSPSIFAPSPVAPSSSAVTQSPAFSEAQKTPKKKRMPAILSKAAVYFQSPARPTTITATENSAWESAYDLPLGTIPEERFAKPLLLTASRLWPRTSTNEEVKEVVCQVKVVVAKETATGTEEIETICGHNLSYVGGPSTRQAHIDKCHADIRRALDDFRAAQEIVHERNLAAFIQRETNLGGPLLNGGFEGIREDVMRTFQEPTEDELKAFVNLLLSLATRLGISFQALQSPIFEAFLKHVNPGYNVPTTAVLRNRLRDTVSAFRRHLIGHLRTTLHRGAITKDAWTNGTGDKKFLGVTLHFMDDQFRMKSIAIDMAEMLQSQKADYICLEFDKVIKGWELEGKLLAATTDGAFNMRKSVALYNEGLQRGQQRLSWIHCASHTLQLCINGAFRKSKATGGLLEKCQEIVRFFKSCGAAKKALDVERTKVNKKIYKFITATETRWNSTLTLMRRVHELAGEMAAALDVVIASSVQADVDRARKMKAGLLSQQERGEVDDLCNLLTPAAKLTHEVGGSKYPTISSVYPKIYGLLPALDTFTIGPAKEMSEALMHEIEFRFTVTQIPEVTLVAMFLNPGCFDYEFFHRDSVFLDKARILAQEALLTMADELNPPDVVDNEDDEDDLLAETNKDLVSREIDRYGQSMLHDPKKRFKFLDRPQDFWMSNQVKLPLLAGLFRAYHCIQASSSESERLFSKAGLLMSSRKANLSYPTFFNMLLHDSFEKYRESCLVVEDKKKKDQ